MEVANLNFLAIFFFFFKALTTIENFEAFFPFRGTIKNILSHVSLHVFWIIMKKKWGYDFRTSLAQIFWKFWGMGDWWLETGIDNFSWWAVINSCRTYFSSNGCTVVWTEKQANSTSKLRCRNALKATKLLLVTFYCFVTYPPKSTKLFKMWS